MRTLSHGFLGRVYRSTKTLVGTSSSSSSAGTLSATPFPPLLWELLGVVAGAISFAADVVVSAVVVCAVSEFVTLSVLGESPNTDPDTDPDTDTDTERGSVLLSTSTADDRAEMSRRESVSNV